MDELAERMLERAQAAEAKDGKAAEQMLAETAEIGRTSQAYQGRMLTMLAQIQRVGAVPGGLDTWIATHLDVTRGTAIGIARQAKTLGTMPQLAAPLASGTLGPATINALTRTARATRHEDQPTRLHAMTQTLTVARTSGPDAAKRHVRILEETLTPGRAEQDLAMARARSYLRLTPTDSGMCRIEGLLDPERATILRATIDQTVSAFLRARQYDHTALAPDDIVTTEQLQAEALTRLAQTYTTTSPATRDHIPFTSQTLYYTPLNPTTDAGLTETVYGDLLPRTILPPPGTPGTHLIEYDEDGQPVRLDGQPLDHNPEARLADPAQRTALAWRDRTCTHPGCHRPPTYALHAHHRTPHSLRGPTTLRNLTLLCAAHHTLTHLNQKTTPQPPNTTP
ncbi:HNH endonuclease signature motif containing protein [Actinospica robiniae]|uniref:HNH endonuclease signature motif containing protein n=1 Tax=Actinospica robiniae TaxID=304901 RepID=UPI0004055F6B|nr:HNH endonuclease signature motif containing protein [Actinospica robiniae]